MDWIRFVFSFLRSFRKSLLFAQLLSFLWVFELLFWPFFFGELIDAFTLYDKTKAVTIWHQIQNMLFLGGGASIVVDGSFRLRDYILQVRCRPRWESEIRTALFDHVQRRSPECFREEGSGALAAKIGHFVSSVSLLIREILVYFFPALLLCSVTVFLFFRIHPVLAWITALWIFFHIGCSLLFVRKCSKYWEVQGNEAGTLSGKIVDTFSNHFTVHLFYRFDFEKRYFSRYQDREKKAQETAAAYSVKMWSVLCLVLAFEIFAVTGCMIRYKIGGEISTGRLAQGLFSIWNVAWAMLYIANRSPEVLQAFGTANRAFSVMRDTENTIDPVSQKPGSFSRGEIVFQDVVFRYGKGITFPYGNLTIRQGEKVGLVGYSGAGKSTFVRLILRFLSPDQGSIRIDGQDIATVSLESLRKSIAFIPQDPTPFHRSFRENICYGFDSVSEEEMEEAAKRAHCAEFIEKTEDHYETVVGERGSKLSGGERQRIAMARAMLSRPAIVILDEATSALDAVTETYLEEGLDRLTEGRTTLIIAHRFSTLKKVDRILVFEQGKIVEDGTEQELLAKKGLYFRMKNLQAEELLPG